MSSDEHYAKRARCEAKQFHFDPTAAPPPIVSGVRHVVVLMRHGDRTPLHKKVGSHDLSHLEQKWEDLLPGSSDRACLDRFPVHRRLQPEKENTYAAFKGAGAYGQLTAAGVSQCRAVGAELRRRYGELPVHVISTDFARTIDTAKAVLWGLAPPAETPVPEIIIRAPADEFLLPNFDGACGRFAALKRICLDNAAERLREQRQHLEAALEPLVGKESLHSLQCPNHFRPLCIHERAVGHVAGVDLLLQKLIDQYFAEVERVIFEDRELLRLASGRLVKFAADKLAVAHHGGEGEMTLLLAHDSTLIPFLIALGVHRSDWPLYASTIVLEATTSSGPLTQIRILVNDDVRKDWHSWASFQESIEGATLTEAEYAEQCRASS